LPKRRLIVIGWDAEGQLLTELLGNPPLFAQGGLVVEAIVVLTRAQSLAQFIAGSDMHADQQSAALAVAARPAIHMSGKMTPAAQIEIPDTEIGTLGDLEGFLQCRQQRFFYVVEDSWHRASPAL
jgi:hypothetical protein